jgi:hypothetical protein
MSAALRSLRPMLKVMPSPVPRRQGRLRGQAALVDGISYDMPINSDDSQVILAAFPCDLAAAAALLPGKELHPVSLGRGRGLLLATVVNYVVTDIGSYIEYSLGIAVTHGRRPGPPLLPVLLPTVMKFGQYVVDLPVSTEISVKGGKGIWGMPKHQASLDFVVTDTTASAAYDKDGQRGCYLEIDRPPATDLPIRMAGVNYCAFRGLLMKSYVYFDAVADVGIGRSARGRIEFGDAPGVAGLRTLDVADSPILTLYMPQMHGTLDDHFEAWFLTADTAQGALEGHWGEPMTSVASLGYGREWPAPPTR